MGILFKKSHRETDALTAHNKAYLRRSEYLAWASPHCGKRPPQRQVSKTLCERLCPPPLLLNRAPAIRGRRKYFTAFSNIFLLLFNQIRINNIRSKQYFYWT